MSSFSISELGKLSAPAVAETPWSLPITHLSASSANMLQVCPEQYRQRYILGKKERPGAALVLGSAFHNTVEFNWRQKVTSFQDLPVAELETYYGDVGWPQSVEDHGKNGDIVWDDGKPDALRSKGAEMLKIYQEQAAPAVQPVEVEAKHSVPLDGTPLDLLGYIDLTAGMVVEHDTSSTVVPAVTIDMKTAKQKTSKLKPQWRLQGRVYQLFSPLPVHWHVITKAKEPTVWTPKEEEGLTQPYVEEQNAHTRRHLAQLAQLANHFYATIGPDDPWPTLGTGHDWRCDWCGYRPGCPAWQ
jgi:PD-(D/E)XK nuclease superfamily